MIVWHSSHSSVVFTTICHPSWRRPSCHRPSCHRPRRGRVLPSTHRIFPSSPRPPSHIRTLRRILLRSLRRHLQSRLSHLPSTRRKLPSIVHHHSRSCTHRNIVHSRFRLRYHLSRLPSIHHSPPSILHHHNRMRTHQHTARSLRHFHPLLTLLLQIHYYL